MMTENRQRKGVILRLLGVAFIFVGLLDAMLSWRGGLALSAFYVSLVGSGFVLFAMGAIRNATDIKGNTPSDWDKRGSKP